MFGHWWCCLRQYSDVKASVVECSLRCRYTMRGHTESVNAVQFLPYSNILLTCSADKTVSIWDARTVSYHCRTVYSNLYFCLQYFGTLGWVLSIVVGFISSCHGQIGSLETEHSVSPLHECGIDCQPTSDSCVRRRHSSAILRHFYSLLLTELR